MNTRLNTAPFWALLFFMTTSIVVTAQRKEGVQDVPISITAINADQLGDLGSWQSDLSSSIDLSFGGSRSDGNQLSSNSSQSIRLRGIGAPIADKTILVGNLELVNQVSEIEVLNGPRNTLFAANVNAGVLRQLDFLDKTVYGGVTVGYGTNSFKEEGDNLQFDQTDNTLTYGVEIGKYTDVAEAIVYTGLEYTVDNTSFEGGNELCSVLGLSANLIGAAGCGEIDFFHRDYGPDYRLGKTDKGAAFVDGDSRFGLGFGSVRSTFDLVGGGEFEATSNKSAAELAAGFGFYLLNDLAILFGADYDREGRSFQDSDDSQSSSEFGVTVGAQAHLGLIGAEKLNNVFLSAEFEFGSFGATSEFGGQSTNSSQGFTNFGVSAGVNHHITNSLYLVPRIGYRMGSLADSDANTSNLNIGMTLRQNLFATKGRGAGSNTLESY